MFSISKKELISPPPLPRPQRWAEVLLILLVFFAAAGDPPPAVNEPHYLCRLKHYWNPEWCPGDLFLDSTDTQLVLIWLFGWITRFFSLTVTAWIGRVVAWTMLAWAWQRLSWRLVPRPLAAVLSGALFVTCINVGNLAGEWVVGGVEAKCFAYGFVLLALRELVDGRWNRLWLSLGAAAALHPLVGGWSVIVCAGVWLIDDRRRTALSSMRPGLVAGGALSLLGVVPALGLTWNEPANVVDQANVIYVFERLPHHLALLHLPEQEFTARVTRHGSLLIVLGLLSLAARNIGRLQNVDGNSQIDVAGLRRIALFAWGAVLLAVVGFTIETMPWNHPERAASLLKYYWFRLTDVAAALAVALYCVAVVALGIDRQRRWAVALLAAALAIAGWQIASLSISRYRDPIPPADRKLGDYAAWTRTCNWIVANTPPDALFLTPRNASSFKWRTGRPEVVTHKDIPQDAQSIVEWNNRLHDIFYIERGGHLETLGSLGYLTNRRIQQIIDDYAIDYIVAEGDVPLPLPIVYPTDDAVNEEYVIYKVIGRHAGDRE